MMDEHSKAIRIFQHQHDVTCIFLQKCSHLVCNSIIFDSNEDDSFILIQLWTVHTNSCSFTAASRVIISPFPPGGKINSKLDYNKCSCSTAVELSVLGCQFISTEGLGVWILIASPTYLYFRVTNYEIYVRRKNFVGTGRSWNLLYI